MTDDDKNFFKKEFREIFINALNQVVIPRLDRIHRDLQTIKKDIFEIKAILRQISKLNAAVGI